MICRIYLCFSFSPFKIESPKLVTKVNKEKVVEYFLFSYFILARLSLLSSSLFWYFLQTNTNNIPPSKDKEPIYQPPDPTIGTHRRKSLRPSQCMFILPTNLNNHYIKTYPCLWPHHSHQLLPTKTYNH